MRRTWSPSHLSTGFRCAVRIKRAAYLVGAMWPVDSRAMTNILFICGKARERSPTAAAVAADRLGTPMDCTGLSADADERIRTEQLVCADTAAVMEKTQLSRPKRQMGSCPEGKRLVCLDIPDNLELMQTELVALVARKFGRFIR